MTTTVEDVENNITLHKQLTQGIMEYVEKIRDINEVAKKEQEIPVAVFEMLSRASALIQTMPRELEERKQYLENNKNYRLQYDSLVERLNSWIEEAQIKLRPIDSGVDYENLTTDLEEHKTYFSQESKLKELLHNIHDIANKIWASLAPKDQDKINHEQEFLTQLVKNTLNSELVLWPSPRGRQLSVQVSFVTPQDGKECMSGEADTLAVSPLGGDREVTPG